MPSDPPGTSWPPVISRPEVRIVLVYVVLASVWVIGSDRLLQRILPDSPVSLQSLKGINFVITTSVLLYFVLRRAYRGWRQAERRQWDLMSDVNETFRNLSIRIEALREADRTRLSRELHDQLGQALTGVKMDLRWVEGRLELREDRALNPLTDRLVEAQEQVDKLIAMVQRIATDLRPDVLDNLGLAEALAEEGERFAVRSGIPCEIGVGELPDELPPEVGTAAFRIFQEALANVVRHASASKVKIGCQIDADVLKLEIADDGKGMPAGVDGDSHSLGLLGMRERAELLGGKVTFTTGDSGGTRVMATLPWRKSS